MQQSRYLLSSLPGRASSDDREGDTLIKWSESKTQVGLKMKMKDKKTSVSGRRRISDTHTCCSPWEILFTKKKVLWPITGPTLKKAKERSLGRESCWVPWCSLRQAHLAHLLHQQLSWDVQESKRAHMQQALNLDQYSPVCRTPPCFRRNELKLDQYWRCGNIRCTLSALPV